jgi:ParB family chromosome partitioning protein
METIPVIVKNLNEKEVLEIALVENIQREGLSAIEEAEGLERLTKEFNYTQDQLAKAIGKSRSHVANLLRLNQLPQSVKDKISYSLISMGHARCLVGHMDAEKIAQLIIDKDLTVRQTENLVRNWSKQGVHSGKDIVEKMTKDYDKEDDFRLLAQSLSEKFGIKITLETSAYGGKIIFHYTNLEQLDSILSKLN